MRTIVIGGGLIGLASAYFLHREGDEVVVLERAAGAGLETSFANGALLTPSMPEPWNSPGYWKELLRSFVRSDSPVKLRAATIPSLAFWGLVFLRNSGAESFRRNTLSNLRLALHSMSVMEQIRADTGIGYERQTAGTLRLFRESEALERALSSARFLRDQGLECTELSRGSLLALEPGLQPIEDQLAGGIHYPGDETGDAHLFCVVLANALGERGVELRFNTEVLGFETTDRTILGARTAHEIVRGDRYVVAAATGSRRLLTPLGINLPVQPAKGYSVTIDVGTAPSPLRVSIVDDQLHAVIVLLQGRLRAAGTAEFAGYDRSLPRARVANLVNLVRRVLPAFDFKDSAAKPWCGLRAMSADGVPVIGATPYRNLFVNTGHGHLGWTMAAGSGQFLCDLMSGRKPALPSTSTPYSLSRFV